MSFQEGLVFEWDSKKANINFRKHGVRFETAMLVFNDADRITYYDVLHSDGEDRYVTIGRAGRILFVVFIERIDRIRIVSARLANLKERKMYYGDNDLYFEKGC